MGTGTRACPSGAGTNPFISQQVSGDRVAIDPTYGLNEGGTTTSGVCSATCLKLSSTSVAGQCSSCGGASERFVKSTGDANTSVCQ